jgi:hypothetical protein
MNIILNEYRIPDKGTIEIHQLVTLEISSAQARKLVNRFLLMEVSTMLAANTPDLVVGKRTVWRVPVWIGFLHQGRFAVGALDVDAHTGTILDSAQRVAAVQTRAAEIAAALPAYTPNPHIAVEYLAPDAVIAQNCWPHTDHPEHELPSNAT